ncbi:cytidine deaminase [Leucobacter sp. PH1c]|uniref:cytidine deaminase n=1 Tax=Leucobacter sp. PH1c TaxID=1397278 RepID=UPI00046A9C48|nr:cytidine deaminase [Leucobacter sp. PH1c]
MSSEHTIDWEALRAAALAATEHSYAPYSGLAVGCAALVDDGRVVVGCNVENASYGLTLCAECTMLGALHLGGGGRLRAFVCVDGAGAPLTPCGRCRQLLFEAAAPGMLLATASGPRTIDELLPDAFGPSALPAR